MHLIKIGVAALNQTPLDWRGNTARIIEALHLAQHEGVQFLGLPEMALSGYGCEDTYFSPGTHERALEALETILPYTKGMVVNLGLPLRYQGALFNAIVVAADGDVMAVVPKKFLAGDGVHYEPRWFKEWPSGFTDVIAREELCSKKSNLQVSQPHLSTKESNKKISANKNEAIPIGDLCFQWKDIRFGYEICEEAWVAQRPGAHLAEHSVDLIFNPSASHFAFGKNEVRKRFVLEGSRAFSCVYAYSNLLGNEAGRLIYDGSLFIASNGELIHESQRFSFKDVQIISSVVDLNLNRIKRQQTSSFNPVQAQSEQQDQAHPSKVLRVVEIDNQNLFKKESSLQRQRASVPVLSPLLTKNEEFLHAVSLGLFDYLRKSHSRGFAISISGGTDSAVVAVLSFYALKLALSELGIEAFLERFSYIPELQVLHPLKEEAILKAVMVKMIHGAYQATQNSSKETQRAASELSRALGITYSEWSVETIKSQYETLLAGVMGRPLTWAEDDLSLQNIQARVRAPGIWMLANLKSFLLLATSNRSEAAVGYTTMDGDTAGGLSPIAGVDKAFLIQWIRWMGGEGNSNNSKGGTNVSTEKASSFFEVIPELKLVFNILPTAELRPQAYQQIDEKDLMPYPLLDFIERHLMIDRLSPIDLMPVLIYEYPQYTKTQLRDWLVLFLKLWTRNQWKRERFAPSFHLDSESLDPKTWCRFPILSKSFDLDIEQLQKEY